MSKVAVGITLNNPKLKDELIAKLVAHKLVDYDSINHLTTNQTEWFMEVEGTKEEIMIELKEKYGDLGVIQVLRID